MKNVPLSTTGLVDELTSQLNQFDKAYQEMTQYFPSPLAGSDEHEARIHARMEYLYRRNNMVHNIVKISRILNVDTIPIYVPDYLTR